MSHVHIPNYDIIKILRRQLRWLVLTNISFSKQLNCTAATSQCSIKQCTTVCNYKQKYRQRIKSVSLHLMHIDIWHGCQTLWPSAKNNWKNVGNEEHCWSLLHVTLKVRLKRQLWSRRRTTLTFCKTTDSNCFTKLTYYRHSENQFFWMTAI